MTQTHALEDWPLDDGSLAQIDAWWRAANNVSVGQIYLPREPAVG